MIGEPEVVERAEQPYVGISADVPIEGIAATADTLLPELFGWLGARGIPPACAPFLKYNVIDMNGRLQIEWGVPVAAPVAGDGRVEADVLPTGRYATLRYRGHYGGLMEANAALLEWVAKQGLKLDAQQTPEGDRFRARVEIYVTNPAEEPDPSNWETVVAFLLAP